MKCLQLVWQGGKLALLTMAGWLAVHGTALAQPQQQKTETGVGSYVMSYALVILAIALGMLALCRPSRRRDRARPEQYEEAKAAVKE
jgi:hypothetical protein